MAWLSDKTKLKLVALFVGAWMAWIMISNANAGQAAGCILIVRDGVVLTLDHAGQIQLPMGKPKFLDETAIQVAERETLEETGIEVGAGDIAHKWPNGNRLYLCLSVRRPVDPNSLQTQVPSEVSKVFILDPVTMTDHKGVKVTNPWRFPGDLSIIRSTYGIWCKSFQWGNCWIDIGVVE